MKKPVLTKPLEELSDEEFLAYIEAKGAYEESQEPTRTTAQTSMFDSVHNARVEREELRQNAREEELHLTKERKGMTLVNDVEDYSAGYGKASGFTIPTSSGAEEHYLNKDKDKLKARKKFNIPSDTGASVEYMD